MKYSLVLLLLLPTLVLAAKFQASLTDTAHLLLDPGAEIAHQRFPPSRSALRIVLRK